MKKLSLLVLIAVLGILQSCEKDIVGEPDIKEISQEPSLTFSTSVSGIVTDQNGLALEEVLVEYSQNQYYTDENGYFKIDNVIASENGGILKFEMGDYFNNYKFFFPVNNGQAFMRVQMIEREESGIVSGASGGIVEISGDALVSFPEKAFVDENNLSYEGDVSVFAHWFDPSSSNISASMPGDLRALNLAGELQQLSTYGMMAVELEASNGAKLQLAAGVTARLEFPVPNELLNDAPQFIETWSLDEETIYWEEESSAELVGGKYIAEVSHFSFWNCDAPFPLVNISGKIVDENGNPLPWLQICIIAFNGAQTGYGWTDSQGGFYGKVPKNQELVMLIKDECGNIAFEQNIGPFSANASFGEIVVDISGKVTVSGVLTCNGMSISSGYAKISLTDDLYYIAEVDEDGNFEITLLDCEIAELSIQGYDLANFRVSEVYDFTVNSSTLDAGEIEVCEQLETYWIYKIDNSPEELLENLSLNIIDGALCYSSELIPELNIPNVRLGDNDVQAFKIYLNDLNTGSGWSFSCLDFDQCENLTFTITELGTQAGEFVAGEYMGEAIGPNGNVSTIMGEFRVPIEYYGPGLSISGQAWIDIDQDGIRQMNEPPLADVVMKLDPNLTNGVREQSTKTDANGFYSFDKLPSGEYEVYIRELSGYGLTIVDAGTDDTVDSDLGPNGLQIELTDSNITNLDVGLISNGGFECEYEYISFPSCEDPEGGTVILYLTGIPPYEIVIEGANSSITNTSSSNVFTQGDLTQGDYFVETFDAIGNACTMEFTMWNVDSLFCDIVTTDAGCLDGEGTAFVEVFGEGNNFTYEWSTGETTQGIENLASGVYVVTVTSDMGCQTICEARVIQGEMDAFIEAIPLGCNNGVLEYQLIANVFGGVGSIQYDWSDGQQGETIIVDGLDEVYELIATDETGCVAFAEFFAEQPQTGIYGIVWKETPNSEPDIWNPGQDVPIEEIIVELYDPMDLVNPLQSTVTNFNGNYNFVDLSPGEYRVKFELPADLDFVNKDVGTNEMLDSDVNPDTGFTDNIVVEDCEVTNWVQAGYKEN